MQRWRWAVLWRLLSSGLWGRWEHTEEEKLKVAIQGLQNALSSWYKRVYRRRPRVHVTRISSITLKMIGTDSKFKLKLKAMETAGFMRFLLETVESHRDRIEGSGGVIESGYCCLDYIDVIKTAGADLDTPTIQRMHDLWNRFCSLTRDWAHMQTPKLHLMFELNCSAGWFGSPWLYHVFLDESLNKILKQLLRNCHQTNFEWLALKKAGRALKRWGERHARPVF